jgi:GntR family transcriptional repressor for pyruvate dehydrogenase complex
LSELFSKLGVLQAYVSELEQHQRESDRIVRYYTDRLISGEMRAGEKLPSEFALCDQFGASRTVVREAIQQLKARGVVDTLNGKGSYIAEGRLDHFQDSLELYSSRAGNVQDWMDLLAMRSLIEVECAREIAESEDRSKIEGVKLTLERMMESREDLTAFAEADIEFHHAIVAASSNRIYIAVWKSLREMSLRFALDTYRSIGQVEDNFKEHETIYQAILNHKADEATRAMKDHLESSRRNLEQITKG